MAYKKQQTTNKRLNKNPIIVPLKMRTQRSPSVITRSRDGLSIVATKLYLFPKRERENIDKTPKRRTMILVITTKLELGSRLCKRKIYHPSHLLYSTGTIWLVACINFSFENFRLLGLLKEKENMTKRFIFY